MIRYRQSDMIKIVLLLMVLILHLRETCLSAEVHTPQNTAVPVVSPPELNETQILLYNKQYQSLFLNAMILSDSTYTYNCHAYAWHVSEGGNRVWINTPGDDMYWGDGSYQESNEQTASKVSYLQKDHSAITTNQSDWVISKWGPGPVMLHKWNKCPYVTPDQQHLPKSELVKFFAAANPHQPFTGTYGDSGTDIAYDMQETLDGRYVVAGTTTSFGSEGRDAWMLKIDTVREMDYTTPYGGERVATLWQRKFGKAHTDRIDAIQQTQDRGYIAAGRTLGNGYDLWVAKLDEHGEVGSNGTWQQRYDTSVQDATAVQEYASAVQETFHDEVFEGIPVKVSDGYLVAGIRQSTQKDILLVKLDHSGTVVWKKAYGGTQHDEVHAIDQTTDGSYVIAGFTNSFGTHDDDAWILKVDASGNVGASFPNTWQKRYGGTGQDYAKAIQQTRDGGYIVAGRSNSPGTAGGDDVWILKLDANGTVLWQKVYGGVGTDGAESIIQTHDGGYVVAGYTSSFGMNGTEAWVLKLDSAGQVGNASPGTWQKTYGGSGEDHAYAIRQRHDGTFLVAGTTDSLGVHSQDILVFTLNANGNILPCCALGRTSMAQIISFAGSTQSTDMVPDSSLPISSYNETLSSMTTTTTGESSCCTGRAVCNGDFEQELAYWFPYQATLTNDARRSGQGLDITGVLAYQDLTGTFESGKTYDASVWCKAASGARCQLFFGDGGATSDPLNYEHTATQYRPGNNDWQHLRVAVTLRHAEEMDICLYGSSNGVRYDDAEVREISCPTGVCNGDFTQDLDFWNAYQSTMSLVPGRTGQGVAVNGFLAYQILPAWFSGGRMYRATVWCKAAPGELCKVFFGDRGAVSDPQNYEHTVVEYLEGDGTWQPLEADLQWSGHAERLDLDVYAPTPGSTVVYDDAEVHEAPLDTLPLRTLNKEEARSSSFRLTVRTIGTGTGRVIEHYAQDQQLFLKAISGPNSKFVGWQTQNGVVSGMIRVDQQTTITAVFEKQTELSP